MHRFDVIQHAATSCDKPHVTSHDKHGEANVTSCDAPPCDHPSLTLHDKTSVTSCGKPNVTSCDLASSHDKLRYAGQAFEAAPQVLHPGWYTLLIAQHPCSTQ